MRPLVTIAGHPIPDPSNYEATTSTVVDSGRNAEGKFIGAVIRDDVSKISMTWKYISAADWADILRLFSRKRGGSFINPVTFYLQDSNNWETKNMYISDRTASIFLRNKDGSIRGYLDPRIALIEV